MDTLALPLSTRELDALRHGLRVALSVFQDDVRKLEAEGHATLLPTFEHYVTRTDALIAKLDRHMEAEGIMV